mmetsp:Transcript_6708/g.11003  ORF Transcript_6708/g.11003 Transcript_6708/m.11003 type:complete len:2055 (+) Transcript_6708:122-6286(+)
MSLVDAVLSLAIAVKGLSDDASDNVGLCKKLGNRVALIPRLLEKFPHFNELDEKLMAMVFKALKDSRELIVQYGKKGSVSRFFMASGIKKKFDDMDDLLGQCIDDLTLSVSIVSSSQIADLTTLLTTPDDMKDGDTKVSDEEKEENIEDLFLLNYNDVKFSIKRGIRKELCSDPDARLYIARFNDQDVVVREPTFALTPDVVRQWKTRVLAIGGLMQATRTYPSCWELVLGGGVEYLDDDDSDNDSAVKESVEESGNIVEQLFVITKLYSSPPLSLISHIASPDWNSSNLERILGYVYGITFACLMVRAQPASEFDRYCLNQDDVMLDVSMGAVLSLSSLFSESSLIVGVTEGSVHFENMLLRKLRWLAPEQLKTDQRGSTGQGCGPSCRDVYTIGLLMCYMLTGDLPHVEVMQGAGDGVDASRAHVLLEGVRAGQLQPYNLPRVTTNPSLVQLLTLCLHQDPKKRPSLRFVLKSIKTLSDEINIALPFNVADLVLPAAVRDIDAAGDDGSGDDSGSDGGLNDFDDLTSQVENASRRVKLFRAANTPAQSRESSVVVFGNKVVLLNFSTDDNIDDALKLSQVSIEDDERDETALGNAVSMGGHRSHGTGGGQGVVIFHIDNTTSMRRNDRNLFTKEVLLRVIPDLLRKNLRVIVNAWASDEATKGKIQTREICVTDDMLEPDNKAALADYIKTSVFDILNPSGKTDLYGSIYQLLDQCEGLSSVTGATENDTSHIYCFILTDGNHNHFAYPTHAPQCVDENYFGVYKGVLKNKKLMFGLSGMAGDIPTAQTFLADKYKSSSVYNRITLTLIGIGDAGTAPLSELARALGEQSSFVGITEVNQADAVFSSIDHHSGDSKGQLQVLFSTHDGKAGSEVTEDFQYVLGDEDSSLVSGCAALDAVKSDIVVNRATSAVVSNDQVSTNFTEESLEFDGKSVMSEGTKYNRVVYSLEELVEEVLPTLSQIRNISYDVTAETFQALFSQLLKDKKNLWIVKTTLFSKKTRYFRGHPIFCAFTVWLKELEFLVESQIASYRMNVEAEMFSALQSKGESDVVGGSVATGAQPAAIVLARLQNNLQNTGKKVHQVHRHVTVIRSIRDRTLNIGMSMLTTELSLQQDSDSVILNVSKKNGKQYSVSWTADSAREGGLARLKAQLETVDISQPTLVRGSAVLQVGFPCFLIQATFDPMTVIRASELVTFRDICLEAGDSRALRFCAEELWDLCSSSNHVVGEELPVTEAVQQLVSEGQSDKHFNMILPLATTPLLMTLYCERGRMYHNGINITGDALALTSATGQWAKVFHDIILALEKPSETLKKQQAVLEVALQCIVSYSYAIDFSVLAPCKNMVEKLFTPDAPLEVLTRDAMSGLTCPLGLAMLTSYLPKEPIPVDCQVNAWNTLFLTVFSRLCEAISGHKTVRYADDRRDPADMEVPYRLLIGELQTVLKRRLHVEWANGSREDKLAVVQSNAPAILECLTRIVSLNLNCLGECGLPTLFNVVNLFQNSLKVKNFGVDRLRAKYLVCEDGIGDISDALMTEEAGVSLMLPILCKSESDNTIRMRELRDDDYDFLLAFVDAIVATKVSPKIVYQPVVNPSYPSFSASENQSLRFEKVKQGWNLELPIANICFIGNVNSGKSSIGGQLLSHLNIVSEKALMKMQHKAVQLGRTENLQYAWVMDSLSEERVGGYTVKPKFNGFQTASRRFNMIDNPGHNDYAANYASGIYHADVVLLVVSAVASEQQLAEAARSMAEEHLVTAFCFGIKQVIVLVNKMDLVAYDEQAFQNTKAKAFKHIKKAGFKVTDESMCVPISAVEGVGFLNIPSKLSWYDGPCLLQALDEISLPIRHEGKALRMVIDDTFKISGAGTVLCGKVERGILQVGDKINIYPANAEKVTVRSIESHGNAVAIARPGDDIGINISSPAIGGSKGKGGASGLRKYRRGMLVGLSSDVAIPLMKRFEVQLFILGKNVTLKVGAAPTMLSHLLTMQVKITRLVETIGKNNVVLVRNPDMIQTGDTCIVELEAREAFPAETIHDCPKLSRFVIQSNRMTVAIGFIRASLL